MKNIKKISIIIPVFNESATIQHSLVTISSEIKRIPNIDFHFIIVNDGSSDNTLEILNKIAINQMNITILNFTRNFGKEAAIYAGLKYSQCDAVIVMDSDLQHPPYLIENMVNFWLNGSDVVEACKLSRGKESFISKFFAQGFYFLFEKLTHFDLKKHSDFKLLDCKVVAAYCALPEKKRFFRGLISWLGFSSTQIFFDVPERQLGHSAWSRYKLFRFALHALTSFSSVPLHVISFLGIFCFSLSTIIGGIALYDKWFGHAVSGFTTVILLILIVGSFIMFGLGLIGLYLEQIFDEIKQRPLYVIQQNKKDEK
jgi:polyisoprenyl-phosphate glycosyltransferase